MKISSMKFSIKNENYSNFIQNNIQTFDGQTFTKENNIYILSNFYRFAIPRFPLIAIEEFSQ